MITENQTERLINSIEHTALNTFITFTDLQKICNVVKAEIENINDDEIEEQFEEEMSGV